MCSILVISASADSTNENGLYQSDAMKYGSQQLLEKYGQYYSPANKKCLKLTVGQPYSISFSDGSSVTYKIDKKDIPTEQLSSAISSLSSTTATLEVTAEFRRYTEYAYVYLYGNCTWYPSTKYITLNSIYSASSSNGGSVTRNASIVTKSGTVASANCSGEITFGGNASGYSTDYLFYAYFDSGDNSSGYVDIITPPGGGCDS